MIPLTRFLISILILLSSQLAAHEIRPTVVTLNIANNGHYALDIKGNLEALLLGIGREHKETEDSPQAAEYNRLRALSATEFKNHAVKQTEQLISALHLHFNQIKVTPQLVNIDIPEVPDLERARTSVLHLSGKIPTGSKNVQWGWPAHYGDNVFRLRYESEQGGVSQWLKDGAITDPIKLSVDVQRNQTDVFSDYLQLGYTHIVPLGVDHILFVLGLFLLSTKWRPLLYQITAFTLAHTITLGMTIYGLISLSPSIVEPLIAASITYVAVENILSPQLKPSRIVLVFIFGLLHGMGFAGVLNELGLPESEFLTALISFNIGVEFGQLSVILAAYLLVAHWTRQRSWYRQLIVIPGSLVIGLVGAYWTIERLFF